MHRAQGACALQPQGFVRGSTRGECHFPQGTPLVALQAPRHECCTVGSLERIKLKLCSSMKKSGFLVLLVVLGVCMGCSVASGQIFILGNLGIDAHTNVDDAATVTKVFKTSGQTTSKTTKPSDRVDNLGVAVSGGAGYQISPLLAVGGTLGYQNYSRFFSSTESGPTVTVKSSEKVSTHLFTMMPFFRIAPIRAGKFSAYLELQLPVGLGTRMSVTATAGNKITSPKAFVFSISPRLVPGMSYAFTPNFSMFASLNCFQIAYDFTMVRQKSENAIGTMVATAKMSHFDFGFSLRRGASLGVAYTF